MLAFHSFHSRSIRAVTRGVWPMSGLFRHLDFLSTATADLWSSRMATAAKSPMKPPNIVVYSEGRPQQMTFALTKVLAADHYTILGLDEQQMTGVPWQDNVQLVVFNGITDHRSFTARILETLSSHWARGGKVLVIDSDFGPCLGVFGAKEQQDAALVDHREYLRVHHQAHGVVSFDRWPKGMLDLRTRIPNVEAIAVDEDMKAVVIGAIRSKEDGLVVYSQVALDAGSDVTPDVSTWLERVLTDILSRYFGLECSAEGPTSPRPAPGPCDVIAFCPSTLKTFLRSWETSAREDRLECPKVALRLVRQGAEALTSSSRDGKPEVALRLGQHEQLTGPFMAIEYFDHLRTEVLGRVVWYGEVLTSTMDLLDSSNIPPGVVCIAGRQMAGRGRGGHVWLSPMGCAMFSLQIRVATHSELGCRLPFVQHLASLAIVDGIRGTSGYENLDLRLKWPNDIYYGTSVKLGGVIVQSTIVGDSVLCTIGCGLNVSNAKPTACLHDVIRAESPELPVLSRERVIAAAVSALETSVSAFQEGNSAALLRRYYARWLHSDASVHLATADGSVTPATVRGLDQFGFLEVDVEGSRVSVQPDGNSFDMLHNMIVVRS